MTHDVAVGPGAEPRPRRLLMTGGSGRLGRALAETPLSRRYDATLLSSSDLDVRERADADVTIRRQRPDVVLHAAAWTDVRAAEGARRACWDVNVVGTRNVAAAAAAVGARLVHVSTDYVFWGGDDRPEGGYREDHVPGPVRNHYALTKLVAEEAVRASAGAGTGAPHAATAPLVLRTSFRPTHWPHPKAFDDVFTSQDYVDVIAAELALLLANLERVTVDTLHVVTERKSVYDLAKRRNPDVVPGSKREAGVDLPDDITLNADRWRTMKEAWS